MAARDDWKYSYEFMNRFGTQLVRAIKARTPVDTGALRADVVYEIKQTRTGFIFLVRIDDHILPGHSDSLPSEYAVYQDQGTKYIEATYFMTSDVPGLTPKIFTDGLATAMQKDIEKQIQNSLRK